MKKNVENEESLNLKPSIPVIGIDLGTTFTCVGTWKIGKVEIIINECGEKTTPSIVSFLKNEIPVGTPAISSLIENPKNTIYDSKRLIGRRFNDKIVQEEIKYWDFKIEENLTNGKPEYVIQIDDKEERYFPEEISSLIIKKVYSFAQEFTNKDKLKAVITVPAQFTNGQRESTKKAAEMAGLEVIRIINEPTAAAIGYLFSKDKDINNVNFVYENNQYHKVRYILVFDLGGGTFDTSIVKVEKKTFEVIATCGDNHLGGEDFTNKLTDYIIDCFKEDEGYEDIDFKDKNNEKTYKAFHKLR
jgi:L1 cell adhesion molecule like protein